MALDPAPQKGPLTENVERVRRGSGAGEGPMQKFPNHPDVRMQRALTTVQGLMEDPRAIAEGVNEASVDAIMERDKAVLPDDGTYLHTELDPNASLEEKEQAANAAFMRASSESVPLTKILAEVKESDIAVYEMVLQSIARHGTRLGGEGSANPEQAAVIQDDLVNLELEDRGQESALKEAVLAEWNSRYGGREAKE